MFGQNWPRGLLEKVENVKSSQTETNVTNNRQTEKFKWDSKNSPI